MQEYDKNKDFGFFHTQTAARISGRNPVLAAAPRNLCPGLCALREVKAYLLFHFA